MNALLWLSVVVVIFAASFLLDADFFLSIAPSPPPDAFSDQVIWITGASSGLGAELALQLSSLGAKVIMSARRMEKLEEVAKKGVGKHKPLLLPLDVTDYEAAREAYERIKSEHDSLDMIVLNAGRGQRMSALDMPFEETVSLMEINFLSTVFMTKLVLPDMVEKNTGKIVGVTSLSGKIGTPGGSSYSATKYAMHGYFDALRSELGSSGVKVSLVLPGPVESDIVASAVRHENRPYQKEGGKMATSRFVNLMVKGLHSDFNEMWISTQPFLLTTYMSQYMPWVSRQLGMIIGPTRVRLLAEAGNPFDVKKLMGF